MKIRNLPTLDSRYWVAMLIASLVGTTLGDFISGDLSLGFVKGLLPLGLILAAIFVVEQKSTTTTEAYYWTAIVLTRTMATNLADLATHDFKLGYALIEVALFSTFLLAMLSRRSKADVSVISLKGTGQPLTSLPNNDVRYWFMLLVASTIGTTLGDFVSENIGVGTAQASIFWGLILVGVFYLQHKAKFSSAVVYWIILIIMRATGTVMGAISQVAVDGN